jgi:hypothetical protein
MVQVASTAAVGFWRSLLLAFVFCCLVINAVSLFSDSVEASSALGFQVTRVADSALVRVTAVDPGGAAEASGLDVGDVIHVRSLSPGDRYRLLTGVYPHERIPIAVSRGGRQLQLIYESGDAPAWRWDIDLWCAASFWMLGFAIVIAWRRADAVEARILCVLIALVPASAGWQAGSWIGFSPFADMLTAIAGYTLTWLSAALLATYAQLFGRPLSPARRVFTALAYISAAGAAIYESVRLVLLWTGATPWVAQTLGPDWNMAWGAAPFLLALACALMGVSAAHPKERGRIAWSTATLSVLYLAQAFGSLVPMLFPGVARGNALVIAYSCINIGTFLAPLGMTYALLNRRLLDINFALNRVAVFSTVSLIIVGLFVLAEWGIGVWLERAGHTANLLASAAVALALGLSIRVVHSRVEHVLDRVFFRKRHEDEQAIRRFAKEAAYVTELDVLIARAVDVLERHADASFVRLALDDGLGHYGEVSENDPAIVSLQTWHRVVDLHELDTQLDGERAYPMVARGRLVGALVLGPKHSHEAYAPDESGAIEEVAHGVASALYVLSQKQSPADDRIVKELTSMRDAIADGFAKINQRLERGGRAVS